MARSVWKGPFVDAYVLRKAEKARESGKSDVIKIWSRRSTILPQFVGLTFGGLTAKPMTVILANSVVTSRGEVVHNVNMAAALLTAVPPLLVYFLLGKFFVAGITAGAIKG